MNPILPEKSLVPSGSRRVTFGGPDVGQPGFVPLPTIVTPCGWVVSEWRPDAGDLALLNAGAPLTVALRSGGQWPPAIVAAGGVDLKADECDPNDAHDIHRFADDGGPAHPED